MATSATITIACDVAAVQFARTWVTWQLDVQLPWVPVDLLQDVQLVASELVTNSLRAHSTKVTVNLAHSDATVRVGVIDDAPGVPAILRPGTTDTHGRGLQIVAAISADWGVRPLPPGKEVWATLGIPAVGAVADPGGGERSVSEALGQSGAVALDAVLGDQSSRTVTDALISDLLEQVRHTMQVDTAAILLLDESGQFLVAAAARGIEEEVRQGVRVRAGQGFAGTIAARRQPVILDEISPLNVVNPLLLRRGITSMLGVPMLAENDQLIGVMHVGSLTPRRFTPMEVVGLQRAAGRAGQVITRHRAFLNRTVATALIQSLTPTLPELPGLDLAARYVPGSQYGVGGDWYDLFRLPSGRIGIVIGDVMGHGLHAATVMGRLRSALRAYALEDDASEGEDPARVVNKLDRKLQHFEPNHLATVLYATLDLASRTLRICSAGHLPPMIVDPVRHAELLPIVINAPIGVSPDLVRRSTEVRLELGELLCLYTDGMVERRTSDIDDELLRLQRALSGARLPSAESACAVAMAEMLGNREAHDDVTILTVLLTDSLAQVN